MKQRRKPCFVLLAAWILLGSCVSVSASGTYYDNKIFLDPQSGKGAWQLSASESPGEAGQTEQPPNLAEPVNPQEPEAIKGTHIKYRVLQKDKWTKYYKKGSTASKAETAASITNLDVVVASEYAGTVKFRTYTEKGWSKYASTKDTAPTKGKIQAVAMKLTGELSKHYDIYYKVHVTDGYWMDWTLNGHTAGSKDLNQRINAIKVRLVKKDGKAPGDTEQPYITAPDITYNMAFSKQKLAADDKKLGQVCGSQKNKTMITGIKMKISQRLLPGDIQYRVAREKSKYGSWTTSGKLAGSENSAKHISRIQIRLTGQLAKAYDIYYRVQIKNYGWLGWTKNGKSAGSTGLGLGITAYQVKLVKKQSDKVLDTENSYLIADEQEYVIKVNKKMNCATVYLHNKPIKAFVCSTGEVTPIGTFHTIERYRWHQLIHEVWGQYCTRIVGHILFHSVPYHERNNKTLFTGAYRKLGKTASAGCIRLTCIDAKWIYDNCKLKTKVIIYNSSNPGPLGKPKAPYLPRGQTWDPTDPAFS
ncbi:MAG: L,D-transpeptidase family protein [Lachnospiraceae bacterium]|nr:L,D-transpeptidase family protein [Lachnospiraceae bacterium]